MVLKSLRLFVKNTPFIFNWDLYLKNLINKNFIITCKKCKFIYHYPYDGKKKNYDCPNCKTENTTKGINMTIITEQLLKKAIYSVRLQFYNGISKKKLILFKEEIQNQIHNSNYISEKLKSRLSESFEEETHIENWKKKLIKIQLREYLNSYNEHHKYL